MNKIIEYISSLWRKQGTNESVVVTIFEQEYKWIVDFIQELGFSNMSNINLGLNQEFIHREKTQKILLSIELSPRKRDWDVISIQLISNKEDSKGLIHKWSVWRSSLQDVDLKKEIRNVSEAFYRVNVSYGDQEPLLLYDSSKLEDIYNIPTSAIIIYSKDIGDLVIKAFDLGCLNLSNVQPLKRECGLWDGIDKNGCPTGGIMWKDEFVGSAHTESE